jgi:hypothetical protein
MRVAKYPLAYGALAALLFAATSANATVVRTPITQITYIQSYTAFGTGDAIFGSINLPRGCDGLWLAPASSESSEKVLAPCGTYRS